MEIWETKYESPEYGLETPNAWKLFNIVLNSINKTYPSIAKEIINNEIELEKRRFHEQHPNQEYVAPTQEQIDKRVKKTLSSMNNYSSRYNWKERISAYELYIALQHRKEKEAIILEWEKEHLKQTLMRPNIYNETLQEIHGADKNDMPLDKKAYAEEANGRAYNKALEAIYNILNSGVQVNEVNTNHKEEKHIGVDEDFLERLRAPPRKNNNDEDD